MASEVLYRKCIQDRENSRQHHLAPISQGTDPHQADGLAGLQPGLPCTVHPPDGHLRPVIQPAGCPDTDTVATGPSATPAMRATTVPRRPTVPQRQLNLAEITQRKPWHNTQRSSSPTCLIWRWNNGRRRRTALSARPAGEMDLKRRRSVADRPMEPLHTSVARAHRHVRSPSPRILDL